MMLIHSPLVKILMKGVNSTGFYILENMRIRI